MTISSFMCTHKWNWYINGITLTSCFFVVVVKCMKSSCESLHVSTYFLLYVVVAVVQSLSCVWLFSAPRTVVRGSSVHEIPRQEYWSGLPFPSPEDLPDPGIEPMSPASSHWQANSLPLSHGDGGKLFYVWLCWLHCCRCCLVSKTGQIARIPERVAISFSRGSSQPRDQTQISCIGRWILYHWAHWATREAIWLHRWTRIYLVNSLLKSM